VIIEQLGEDLLVLQRHDAEQPNAERYEYQILHCLQRAHDVQAQELLMPGHLHLASDSRQVSGLDQLHRQPRFLAGGGKALIHGGE